MKWFGLWLLLFISTPLFATQTLMVWVPGEVGSTEDAQPLMDAWADYLSSKENQTEWRIHYFSNERDGKEFLKNTPPDFILASYLTTLRYFSTHPKILRTLPLPEERTEVTHYLLQGPCTKKTATDQIIMREPFGKKEFNDVIRPKLSKLKKSTLLLNTESLFQDLEKISSGNCNLAIINQTEWITIETLSPQWKSKLQVVESFTLPSAMIVQYNPRAEKENFTTLLNEMPQSEMGKSILTELRLKGFQP